MSHLTDKATNGSAQLTYNPALDGLRAVAILAVVAQHSGIPNFAGYHGVTLFFVISGYLITGLLLREHDTSGRIDFRRFYLRRAARLGPALVVVVAATWLWLAFTGKAVSTYWGGIVGSLTFTTDLIQELSGNGSVGDYFQWSWSLGVEELFYLVWPISLLLLVRWRRFAVAAAVLVAGVAGCWALRFLIAGGTPHDRFYFSPDTNADALLLGALLALVLARWPNSRSLRLVGRVAGPLGLIALVALVWRYLGDTLAQEDRGALGQAALASTGLVLWMVTSPGGWMATVFSWRPLVLVGKMSYGIYLWNLLTIFIFASVVATRPFGTWWGVAWLAALACVSYVSWRFIETPLRRRLAPAASPAPPAVAARGSEGDSEASRAESLVSAGAGS